MTNYSPHQIAKKLRVNSGKIFTWITSGELEAFNVAASPIANPRYRVTEQALDDFIQRRKVKPIPAHTRPTNRYVLQGTPRLFKPY